MTKSIKEKRSFVLDTSVLLYAPSCIYRFGAHSVIIPLSVLDELDRFKDRGDEVGRNSRMASRSLYDLHKQGSLRDGVPVNDDGGIVRVDSYADEALVNEASKDTTDNRILGLCLLLQKNGPVVLITKDINLVIKASSLGIEARDYLDEGIVKSEDDTYSGLASIDVPDNVINSVYEQGVIQTDIRGVLPNQFVMLKSKDNPKKTVFVKSDGVNTFSKLKDKVGVWGLQPKNIEQSMCIDLLLDDKVELVTIAGLAGSGKSLLAIAAGLQKVVEEKVYDSLIITRPVVPVGNDLGFLPGTISEKMEPWLRPIKDCLSILLKTKNVDAHFEDLVMQDIIKVEPLAYIRGRSFHNNYIILDEAQSLSRHEIKAFLTRTGLGSKAVLCGDTKQVDSPFLDSLSNGLSQVVEKFKGEFISGHITLRRCERGTLAAIAADIL